MVKSFIARIYEYSPDLWFNIGIGVFSAVTRMAYDDRVCRSGLLPFFRNLFRQFLISTLVVVLGVGISEWYKFADTPIGISIAIFCGFFARELLEQGFVCIKFFPELFKTYLAKTYNKR